MIRKCKALPIPVLYGVVILSRICHIWRMDFIEFSIEFGKKVKKVRNEQKLTQEELDDETDFGIDTRTLQRIEAGESNIRLETFFKLAMRLNVHPQKLLDFRIKRENLSCDELE